MTAPSPRMAYIRSTRQLASDGINVSQGRMIKRAIQNATIQTMVERGHMPFRRSSSQGLNCSGPAWVKSIPSSDGINPSEEGTSSTELSSTIRGVTFVGILG